MPEAVPDRATGGAVTACTIVARNYLPAARVLAASYREHHPHDRFVVAVIDALPGDDELGEHAGGYTLVGPESFAIDGEDYLRMATAYSLTELATAVKPFLLLRLREESEVVVYLDPDIEVFAPMPEIEELARAHGLVLAPHILHPMPRDGHEPYETVIMGTGIFNLGFLATGPGSEPFLEFWARRLRTDAIADPGAQLFTDQRWVDQVPALFEHHVLRDPGYDVAYWNAHERRIERTPEGTVTAGGAPLRFFHFSGYRPEKPWLLTYHCPRSPRVLLSENAVLRELCDGYAGALRAAGHGNPAEAKPYRYDTLQDGTPLRPIMRRLFRTEWIAYEASDRDRRSPMDRTAEMPPHAFGGDGGAAFLSWLTSPSTAQQAGSGTNRLATHIWSTRTDLRAAFPDPYGEGFRTWCTTWGAGEYGLPRWMLATTTEVRLPPPDEAFGVNLLGYLTASLGLGEMGRILHRTLATTDVPVASIVEDEALSNRTPELPPDTVGEPSYGVSLLCVNADQTSLILRRHPNVAAQRHRIGFWAWELEDFPEWQHAAFDLVDEVWTVSDFSARAIAAHSPVPVHTFPVPVAVPQAAGSTRDPHGTVRFLFLFDYNSVAERKNPWGLVEAFRAAFAGNDDARLTIKSINGSHHPHAAERLRLAAAGDHRIELIEHYVPASELPALYERCDCYVSLHRSEGFGLTVAYASARGLPVIATDYGGTREFLDEGGGWPIPYRMTRVGPGCSPYHADAAWADPDLAAAAAAMREVAENPEEAARRGAAGRERILRERTVEAAADWLRLRLGDAHERWHDGRNRMPHEAHDALRPTRDAEQALYWRPEPGEPVSNPLAPAARRLVLRALDHYDVHQRRVLGTIKHGTDEVLATLLVRIEALERRAGTPRPRGARSGPDSAGGGSSQPPSTRSR